jgi:hypothetical protein
MHLIWGEADLMRQVLTRENLQRAWEQVRANHGAPGIDGMTVEAFPDADDFLVLVKSERAGQRVMASQSG